MKKAKKNRKAITQARADQELAPLAEFVGTNHGALKFIAERLTILTGQRQYPSSVMQWLRPENPRRSEPRFGIGLMMMDVWAEILAGKWERAGLPAPKPALKIGKKTSLHGAENIGS